MRLRWAVVVVVLGLVGGSAECARALAQEGSKWEELAAKQPGPPGTIAVAVLPPVVPYEEQSHQEKRNAEVLRGCVLLNLQRHGFRLVPGNPEASPSAIICETDEALKADDELSPKAPFDTQRAARAGRGLGAQWVLYGRAEPSMDFRSHLLSVKKIARLRVHLWFVDVESGQVVYWCAAEDEVQGSSVKDWGYKPTEEDRGKLRDLLVRMVNAVFDEVAKAFPEHDVGPAVTREQVEELVASPGL